MQAIKRSQRNRRCIGSPFSYLFDGSNADGPPEILLALAVGPDAERVAALHMKPREELLVEHIRRHMGEPSGTAPEFFSVDWSSDAWARGGYALRRGIGGWLRRVQSLAEPAGAIHFADIERATEWRSCMEGAVQPGERAAAEVAQPLGARCRAVKVVPTEVQPRPLERRPTEALPVDLDDLGLLAELKIELETRSSRNCSSFDPPVQIGFFEYVHRIILYNRFDTLTSKQL